MVQFSFGFGNYNLLEFINWTFIFIAFKPTNRPVRSVRYPPTSYLWLVFLAISKT